MHVHVRTSDLGVTDSFELPSGCWDSNPSPPGDQQSVFLTAKPLSSPSAPNLQQFCSTDRSVLSSAEARPGDSNFHPLQGSMET